MIFAYDKDVCSAEIPAWQNARPVHEEDSGAHAPVHCTLNSAHLRRRRVPVLTPLRAFAAFWLNPTCCLALLPTSLRMPGGCRCRSNDLHQLHSCQFSLQAPAAGFLMLNALRFKIGF